MSRSSHAVVDLLGAVHPDDAADALPLREQLERPVDLLEPHLVRYELLQLQLLQMQAYTHRLINQTQKICSIFVLNILPPL